MNILTTYASIAVFMGGFFLILLRCGLMLTPCSRCNHGYELVRRSRGYSNAVGGSVMMHVVHGCLGAVVGMAERRTCYVVLISYICGYAILQTTSCLFSLKAT